MQEQARGIGGYGRDVNDALGNLGPFAEDAAELVDILNRQEGAVTGLIANTGVVFEALTERDGQLRSLIENSNRVFEATALRDEELKETFIALPTFERESAQTLDRLAEFSVETDPLVTQLRPAARELSPTLQDLGALSPDLEALFRELNPLIDASVKGFPAAEQVLEDARPLIAQLDPAMRQLGPIVDFLGLYKPELTAFLANTPAATQAKDTSGIHYLRTVNPLNPENLAVYPRRIGSNRPNAYAKPGIFRQLDRGLPVFDDRHCGAGQPNITNVPLPPLPPAVGDLVPQDLLDRIIEFGFGGTPGNIPAGPCVIQGPYNFGGQVTQYPHVRAR
jgi:ABC-type transporter Mla subunit MlaD